MSHVQSWLRNSAKVVSQSRGSRTPSSRSLTRERKPVSPSSSWSFTSGLWRRRAASCWSSKVGFIGWGSYTENSVEPLLEREPDAYHVVKNSETTAAGILRWQASVCPAACSGWMLVWLYVYMVCWSLSHICFAESKAGLGDERDAVDTGIGESSSETALTSQILNALKEKPAPELSLSSKDLEVGEHQGPWPLQGEACIRFFSPLQTLNHSCQFAHYCMQSICKYLI